MSINKANIAGYVVEQPKFKMTERGPRLEILLEIDRIDEIGKKEYLTIITEKEPIIERLLSDNLKSGDFFVGDCVCRTFNYQKEQKIVCPHCHNSVVALKKAEILNVDINDYKIFYDQKEFNHKGQNKIIIEGRLYDEPKTRIIKNFSRDINYAKFKLICKRPFSDRNLKDNLECDYPFIVAFKNTATQIQNKLKKGDKVLIEGAIQERQFPKIFPNMVCPECFYEVAPRINSFTREIVVEKIDFLEPAKPERQENTQETPPNSQ